MDPEKFRLRAYEEIPMMSEKEFLELGKTRNLVLHNNLVVDYTGFKHPGYFDSIDRMRNQEIYDVYTQNGHSFNADLIVCHKTIARLQNSPKESQGHSFYDKIKDSKLNQDHEKILSKFDFTKPLNVTLRTLNMTELSILTQIPKFLKNPFQIEISPYKSKWKKFYAKNHVTLTSSVFFFCFLLVSFFVFYFHTFIEVLNSACYIFFGLFLWTFLEYLTHRHVFHHNMFVTKTFLGSDLHHCFPTIPDTIVAPPMSVLPKIALFSIVFYFILDPLDVCSMLMGVFIGAMSYNIIHFYIHFGGETSIGWLKKLRSHHLNHHFKDQTIKFGLITTFWDHFYNTMEAKPKVK